MKVQITVEQFDNGFTLLWKDPDGVRDDVALVIPDHSVDIDVGRVIMDDIKSAMNAACANKVMIEIEYKPIKENKNET